MIPFAIVSSAISVSVSSTRDREEKDREPIEISETTSPRKNVLVGNNEKNINGRINDNRTSTNLQSLVHVLKDPITKEKKRTTAVALLGSAVGM